MQASLLNKKINQPILETEPLQEAESPLSLASSGAIRRLRFGRDIFDHKAKRQSPHYTGCLCRSCRALQTQHGRFSNRARFRTN